MADDFTPPAEIGIVGDVGRRGVRFALTDAAGALRRETIRAYDAAEQTTISGALGAFRRDSGLPSLPRRCALSVAGIARNETISITNSRWFISRSGLTAMLQHPPVIINDFAAQAWALSAADRRTIDPLASTLAVPAERPGTYCVLGATTGLGVAALVRHPGGQTTVLPTEAGHGTLQMPPPELAGLLAAAFPARDHLVIEDVVSAPGLLAIYRALAACEGGVAGAACPEEVTRLAAADRLAGRACELVARTLLAMAGNAVLFYGAWDGVFITGKLAAALRPILRRSDVAESFLIKGPYLRLLRDVPRAFVAIDTPELAGAAEALKHSEPPPTPSRAAAA